MKIDLPESHSPHHEPPPRKGFRRQTIGPVGLEDGGAGHRPMPKKRGRSPLLVINALLVIVIFTALLGGGGYYLWTNADFDSPIEESLPYTESLELARTNPSLIAVVGDGATLALSPSSEVYRSFTGDGEATIAFDVEGPAGSTTATVRWKRTDSAWSIREAWFQTGAQRHDLVFREDGTRIPSDDIAVYFAADPDTPLGTGQRQLVLGRSLAAIRDLSAHIAQNPDDHVGYLWRARAFAEVGNKTKAALDYRRVLELSPGHSLASEKLAALEADGSVPTLPKPPLDPEAEQPRPPAPGSDGTGVAGG